ncbi:MAG: apolipoprotein N-acyltransferase [Leptospiraceae bacterium]|nr:apolipoprotein N-acyltransferase [Leptospiraceae bacterium]
MNNILNNFRKFRKTIFYDIFCYILAGVVSCLAFVPFHLTYLIWISPIGLFLLEVKYSGQYKKLFLHGVVISLIICTLSFHWMNYMLVVFGNLPIVVAIFVFILYSIFFNLKIPLFLIIFSAINRKLGRHTIWSAGFSVLFSELLTYQIFPWYWGNAVAGHTILAQVVEFTGVIGLSFLLFVTSYTIFRLARITFHPILSHKNRFILYLKFASLPLFIFLTFWTAGFLLYNKWNTMQPVAKKKILMIQPDAPLEFRDGRFNESMEKLMLRIEKLAIKGGEELGKPDLIVLPESGIPFFSAHNNQATTSFRPYYRYWFESMIYLLAVRFKSNVFFNEIDAKFKDGMISDEARRFYNSSSLYDPNGNRRGSYQKSFLVPFGEYIPMGEKFEFLYDIVPQIARFIPGSSLDLITYYKNKTEVPLFEKPHLKWSDTSFLNLNQIKEYYMDRVSEVEEAGQFLPLICYEVIVPSFVRKFYNGKMPDFIVNITNDKWYGDTIESYQHLELARLRSIEYRRWMVRSTNSGTSVYIDHLGRILNNIYTGLYESVYYSAEIKVIKSPPTFYVLYGDLLAYTYLGFSFLYYLNFILISKRKI